jgi:hypothetical protein
VTVRGAAGSTTAVEQSGRSAGEGLGPAAETLDVAGGRRGLSVAHEAGDVLEGLVAVGEQGGDYRAAAGVCSEVERD